MPTILRWQRHSRGDNYRFGGRQTNPLARPSSDFLAKNPARKVRVPSQPRETDKTTLTWDQLRKVLSGLNLRDRLLLELDMTNALRPSELFGLQWKSFNESFATMSVRKTAYKGKIRHWEKTQRGLTTVHLPKELAAQIAAWKRQSPA